ncbi:MAG: hypothetical protein Q4P06_08495 [Actinomycetaceae bacterium]|nr:hypothetical protein [Actinomycetaceae bacterium]
MHKNPWIILLGLSPMLVFFAFFVYGALEAGSDVWFWLTAYVVAGALALVSAVSAWMQRVHLAAAIIHTLAATVFAIGLAAWMLLPIYPMLTYPLPATTDGFNEFIYALSILGAVSTVIVAGVLVLTTALTFTLAYRQRRAA